MSVFCKKTQKFISDFNRRNFHDLKEPPNHIFDIISVLRKFFNVKLLKSGIKYGISSGVAGGNYVNLSIEEISIV